MDPDQTALIWVRTVCKNAFKNHKDDKADDNCCDWQFKGKHGYIIKCSFIILLLFSHTLGYYKTYQYFSQTEVYLNFEYWLACIIEKSAKIYSKTLSLLHGTFLKRSYKRISLQKNIRAIQITENPESFCGKINKRCNYFVCVCVYVCMCCVSVCMCV